MKYRKLPVVIDAIQLTNESVMDVYKFIHGKDSVRLKNDYESEKWYEYCCIVSRDGMRLKTMESDNETQIAKMSDYIIKGVHGEFYPCDEEVFKKTYEVVLPNRIE